MSEEGDVEFDSETAPRSGLQYRRVEGSRAALAQEAASLLAAWQNGVAVDPERIDLLLKESLRCRDDRSAALAHFVAGASTALDPSPRIALSQLRLAEAGFRALTMLSMSRQVRVEAAWQVREAGSPLLALRTLEGEGAGDGSGAPGVSAVRALCLLDLGRLEESCTEIRRRHAAIGARADVHDRRTRLRCLSATVTIHAAAQLVERGVDCHLTEPVHARRAQPAIGRRDASDLALIDELDAELRGSEDHCADVMRALVVFARLVLQPERAEVRAALTQLAAAQALRSAEPDPQAWLYLGTAYALVGNDRAAVMCLSRAADLAVASGRNLLARKALYDLVGAQERANAPADALSTLRALRRLDAAVADTSLIEAAPTSPSPPGWHGPSTDNLSNRHLHRAVELLRSDGRTFTVDSLAQECGVSRRTLEKAFRLELGHSVAECIRSRRLALARARLIGTQDSVKRIAFDTGYPSASALCHDFKRASGMSPAQFRAQHEARERASRRT